jgi:hypothetical protein
MLVNNILGVGRLLSCYFNNRQYTSLAFVIVLDSTFKTEGTKSIEIYWKVFLLLLRMCVGSLDGCVLTDTVYTVRRNVFSLNV